MQNIGHDLRRGFNNFSLGGNYKNINKWLGELKNIDSSLKRLDKEIATNAKLFGAWGCNEGEDLTDVCQRMTQLMEEIGLIHQAYSIYHTSFRKKIKGLKAQEMLLDDIAKYQKSSKENPIKLMELQAAFDRVSAELLSQELYLLQFKRITIRDAFNSQFDAMIEFGEKMALIAGYGRQITNVIDVGPQEVHTTSLYSGSEYTAAAINQVKVAVTSWEPQPIGNPIRSHIAPSYDELAMSPAVAAYNNRTPPPMGEQYAESLSADSPSHLDVHNSAAGDISSGYWNEVQLLKADHSQTSLNEGQGSDYDNWKQELHESGDRSDDSNPDGSPYLQSQQLQEQQRQLQLEQQRARHNSQPSHSPKSSPSQQHYQSAAATVATGLRHSSQDGYGSPAMGGGRSLPPSTLRRGDSSDNHHPASASPSPSYSSYQHENNVSPLTARYRQGFSDPRDRNRSERMDNSDLYKNELGTTIASRFARTPAIMDEK
ncbi:hypothetical protein BGZ65_001600 [Modicella reniformis]|uniref:Eisosome component PIL1-domain-containing protein n=1 Tax=Modicella reniformis TaxID=1440133 RepID=A0A9P6M2Y8_9FUNG|nr:hypothetical protein BGZ65_001600 [Modicella reniformis]